MFIPYAKEFPVQAALYVAPLLRGNKPGDLNLTVNAFHAMENYAYGRLFPLARGEAEAAALSAAKAVEDFPTDRTANYDDAADYLEALAEGRPVAQAIPWAILLPVFKEVGGRIIQHLIEKRLGGRALALEPDLPNDQPTPEEEAAADGPPANPETTAAPEKAPAKKAKK